MEIQSKQIEFYSVNLHITADFSGLRYMMFYYPVICGFIAISMNLFFILFIGFMCWCCINKTWISNNKKSFIKSINGASKLFKLSSNSSKNNVGEEKNFK